MTPSTHEITDLLKAWSDGDADALEELAPLVYSELRRLARGHLRGERPGHTLQTGALVNEAFLRLIDWKNVRWQNRAHFLGIASQLMRKILVDHARARHAAKRTGICVTLDGVLEVAASRGIDITALNDALFDLAMIDKRKSRVVELRYFGGLTVKETAEVLGVSPRTIRREWEIAQAWLHRELSRKLPGKY